MKIENLQSPYFVHTEGLPGLDFNRHIVLPGANEEFPQGVIGIYVDDDFWCVAALPISYLNVPLRDVVEALWPEYAAQAEMCPDHGTVEQRIYQLEGANQNLEDMNKHLQTRLHEADDELVRYREQRPRITQRRTARQKTTNNYFVRQYQHLAIAMAHEAVPYTEKDKGGVCTICDLLWTDRVHSQRYRDLKAQGHTHSMTWHGDIVDDEG